MYSLDSKPVLCKEVSGQSVVGVHDWIRSLYHNGYQHTAFLKEKVLL